MKLIYLHQYFTFPDFNGGTRSYDLAYGFVKKGMEVEVITSSAFIPGNYNKGWNTIERDGLKMHILNLNYSNNLSNLRRIIIFIQFFIEASIKLISLKPDIVLATSTPLTIGIPVLVKRWIHKTPYIFEVRDVWPEVVVAIGAIKNKFVIRILYLLEKVIYQNAFAIVPLSLDMKQSILSRYSFTKDKIKNVIENISEIDRFNIEGGINMKLDDLLKCKPRFSILYAGTFGKVNGLSYVIELAEKLLPIDSSIVFVLVGDGIEKNKIIKEAINRKLLNKNIFILDPVSKSELPELYSFVDMGSSFVISIEELWANSANKFFDSLAASKPILINHGGWQRNIIEKYNIGFSLPSKLNDKSILKFVEYTRDTELHNIQRKNAFRKAKNSYSLDIALDKYLIIINDID